MDTFGQYLETIGRWPLLTPAQEIELARLKQAGIDTEESIGARKPTRKESRIIKTGKRSAERMVMCNLRLVVSIAKRFVNNCNLHDIEDLVQYGSIGLKRAVEKFDPQKGYKLSTYASWWIKQEIQRGIYKADRMIRLPEHSRLKWARLQRYSTILFHQLGRAPTADELIKATDISKKEYALITKTMERTLSLNYLLETGSELIDCMPNESNGNEITADYTPLLNSIQSLNPDERDMINRRFGIDGYAPHTYNELGDQCKISRQGAKDRVDKIQNRIKYYLSSESA
jgi:RNA polymerase primary sigma factor